MEQLIPIASKLQDVLGAVGQNTQLDLPQIVVVRYVIFLSFSASDFLGVWPHLYIHIYIQIVVHITNIN